MALSLIHIYKQQVEEMDELIHNQDDLNRQLRMQRHDFINHLQVIYALLQMDESDQAMAYMDKVYKDLQRVSSLLKTKSSAVNGLLAAKSVQGEKRGIRMAFDIKMCIRDRIRAVASTVRLPPSSTWRAAPKSFFGRAMAAGSSPPESSRPEEGTDRLLARARRVSESTSSMTSRPHSTWRLAFSSVSSASWRWRWGGSSKVEKNTCPRTERFRSVTS